MCTSPHTYNTYTQYVYGTYSSIAVNPSDEVNKRDDSNVYIYRYINIYIIVLYFA